MDESRIPRRDIRPDIRLDIGSEPGRTDAVVLSLSGSWTLDAQPPPPAAEVDARIREAGAARVVVSAREVDAWDSRLPAYVAALSRRLAGRGQAVELRDAPEGVLRLLDLASAGSSPAGEDGPGRRSPLEILGLWALRGRDESRDVLAFIGETAHSLKRLLMGKARFPVGDVWLLARQCGADALPIVSLISLLVGLILAFVGAVQLKMFGAQIYVASLVGIAVVRVMGAIMAGIIMAGRTGAAFAAQLGAMNVNEEIDALRTLDLDPVDFLVLPRLLALTAMMPLLCLYADCMGILGGLIVSVGMLDLNMTEYLNMTRLTVGLDDFWIGLFHSLVFGVLVALSGCMRGMRCGRSASAVGRAVTSAVVTGIVSIIAATAVITVACDALGI